MADGVAHFRTVQRVEVEILHPFTAENFHHVHRDAGAHQFAGFRIIVQPFKHGRHPRRNADVGHIGKFFRLLEVRHRQDPRNDFNINPRRDTAVAEAQIAFNIKEELGDRTVCTGINFTFQVEQVSLGTFCFRVYFRIGGDGNIEIRDVFQQGHQVGRIHFRLAAARRQVTAQGHNVANTVVPVILSNRAQLVAAGVNTGQMRYGFQTGAIFNAFNDAVRTVTFAGVGAIGDRDKFWLQAAQTVDRVPQGLLHFTGARREKLERNVNLPLHFGQTLIQRFPLVGVKKAHTLPLSIACHYCCVVNIYPFRRLDVKMPQKTTGVNRKIGVKSE